MSFSSKYENQCDIMKYISALVAGLCMGIAITMVVKLGYPITDGSVIVIFILFVISILMCIDIKA